MCGAIYCLELDPPEPFVGLSSISALDVIGDSIYAVSSRGDGLAAEYTLTEEGGLAPTGLSFELDNPDSRGLATRPSLAVLGRGPTSAAEIIFFDFDAANRSGDIVSATFSTVVHDRGGDLSGPEIVVLSGREHLVIGDRGDVAGQLEFYDPDLLSAAGRTGDEDALLFAFDASPNVNAIYFWEPILVLVTREPARPPQLLFVDPEASIAAETAVTLDVITLPIGSAPVGFHALADGRALVADADGDLARLAKLRVAE